MNWKGREGKRSWPNLRYYPGIWLEGLMKTTKNLHHDSRSPGRGLNHGPHEYEAGMLHTRPRSSVGHLMLLKITKELVQRFVCLETQY
jgi:hypothetical protein